MNVARQAALKAGLPVEVPAETVNRVCGSGLQAVVHAVEAIRVGYVDTIVAGGTESMSNAPYLLEGRALGLSDGSRRGDRFDAARRADLRHQRLPHGHHRGRGRDPLRRVARRSGRVRRREPAPRRRRRSQTAASRPKSCRSRSPQKKGAPISCRRPTNTRGPARPSRQLAALKPAFKKDGTVTAGNASGINDGAAALVVTTADKARRIGTPPLARILSYASTGVDPKVMGIGPVPAVRKVLERARADASTTSTCSS